MRLRGNAIISVVEQRVSLTAPCGNLLRALVRDRSGNTLAIMAAALGPLLALVGGGVDLGRSHLSQSRLQQACDAGVLAARKRLGSQAAVSGEIPDAAADVGQRFFNINFRDGSYGTRERSFVMMLEDDFAISGVASVSVPTTIMQIFGFTDIPLRVQCEAQINFADTDIMMVLDVTGSMAEVNPGDAVPRIEVLKETVASFHGQLSAAAMAGSRVRYGFVPYSTNVNVLHLLRDEWVVDEWAYQSRKASISHVNTTRTRWANFRHVSGTRNETVTGNYAASFDERSGYYCPNRPADTYKQQYVKTGTTTEVVLGPPPGTRTTTSYQRTTNGAAYSTRLSGQTCNIIRVDYANYVEQYDEIREPAIEVQNTWLYGQYLYDVSDWRTASNGCIEERETYEIVDYANVDFSRALDLDLDLIPGSNPAHRNAGRLGSLLSLDVNGSDDDDDDDEDDDDDDDDDDVSLLTLSYDVSKWRPMYPGRIFLREMKWDGSGSFKTKPKSTTDEYIAPASMGTASCPPPARKLGTITPAELQTYLANLRPSGSTYHDIGMIWGGRLISPTGLFAAENADRGGGPTSRHLIFLTDGETAPLDVAYSSYGAEPIDRRRWSPSSDRTLADVVEQRFTVACNEVKKRNITVWVIGFGTELTDVMRQCAGEGRYFEAADAAELNASFATIADSISDLRVTR